jgi:hypothetical protein
MKNSLYKVSFLLLFFYAVAACKDNNSSTAENPTHQEQIRKIDNDKNSSSFEYPTNQEQIRKIDDYKKMMPDKGLRLEKEKQENEKISVLAREAANKILKKTSVWALIDKIDPNMFVELKSLLDAPLTGPGSKKIEELKNGLNFATRMISDYQKISKVVPDDLIQMKNDFAKKIAEQEKNHI